MSSPPRTGPRGRRLRLAARREQVGLSQRKLAERLGVERSTVARWEDGTRTPQASWRPGLARLLRVSLDGLEILLTTFEEPETGTNRREAISLAGRALTLAVARPWAPLTSSQQSPDEDLVTMLRAPTLAFRRMEGETPSSLLLPVVREHYRLAKSLTDGIAGRPEGFAALSEVAGFVGWLAWDTNDASTARSAYADSVRWAKAADDKLLHSYMAASFGHFAIEAGDIAVGGRLIDKATSTVNRKTSARGRAWMTSLRAISEARNSGGVAACHRSLDLAEKLAGQSSEQVWPFVFTFDETKAARWRSLALRHLGDHAAACSVFAAVENAPWAPKQRAVGFAQQAESLALLGKVEESVRYAAEALALGTRYQSERVISAVRLVRTVLPAEADCIGHLDDALEGLYSDLP